MNGPSRVNRWAPLIAGAVVAAVVGMAAYNFGFAHGLAQQLPPGATAYPWPHRPWGFGFGLFFPLLFGFLLVRLLFGAPWRRHWYGGYYGAGCYPTGAPAVPPAFDEWHRRAHERDTRPPAPPAST